MTTIYRIKLVSTTTGEAGNFASQCRDTVHITHEAAEAAITADPTAGPDVCGNTCELEIVEEDAGDLMDYETADELRPATADEAVASIHAAALDGGRGVISVDGRSCYVA